MAASAQLDARATAAGLLAASTALQEIRKAAEYQRAFARAIEAKPAARSPAAASLALRLLLLLLEGPGGAAAEKRAEPVPEGVKEARPGEEEKEAAAAATLAVEVGKGD